MLRGSASAASRDRVFALAEDHQQSYLTKCADQSNKRRAEFAARIPAIAAQVASEVLVAVAEALRAARAGYHEYLDHAPTTTSTPTVSLADDNASVSDASVVVSAQRSASTFTQQQQQQEEEDAPRQTIENRDASVLAAWMPATCSTQCPSRAAIVSVPAPASPATPASSKVTINVVEHYCVGLEPAASTSTPTTTLDVLGACSTAANSHTHNAISTTIIPTHTSTLGDMAMDISMPTHTSTLGDMYSVDASAATCSTASPGGDNATTLVSVAAEASTAIEIAPSVAAPLVCLGDLHFKLYTGAISMFQSVPTSTSSRCSAKSLDQATNMELPESALGVCPPTRVACAYFHSSLMPLSATVLRSARVQKVNRFQLLNNNDNISVTKEQDK
ncbi:unnamed protein product [Triticum turgidum subsp. durum]|uniref:Uncharacterized protein n=1 Tax=Triticum turgidum subsp. durum TaxID=4567 RepID=A0A9R0QG96_TRITD|nr:unnamed protein product [Triticum turgidum subsp. durum]